MAKAQSRTQESGIITGALDIAYARDDGRLGYAVKFVLPCYGSRGDLEPSVAVGRELLRRGHEVRMAVPPDHVGFAESVGLEAVAYGVNMRRWLDLHSEFWARFPGNLWKVREVAKFWREVEELGTQSWGELTTTLKSLADGADLVLTGLAFEEVAANVTEYYDIPLATLHWFPMRVNSQVVPNLPAPLIRSGMAAYAWLLWRMAKKLEDAQRRELGLPKTTGPVARRMSERGSLEIQGYDEVCFPGLAAEWAKFDGRRPFVGGLTLELATDADDEVASWIAAGTPPIFFGFGSIPVESASDTIEMISAACAQLGERALICSGWSDFSDVPRFEHVKVVDAVNYAAIFPACRAVVHHGGAGSTAAGLRAGVPTLILWSLSDQAIWGSQLKRLKVGTARRITTITLKSLVADLRRILAPEYAARAREIATCMTKPSDSVAAAADLVENFARLGRVG